MKGSNVMAQIKEVAPGIILCIMIAVPAWLLGITFPIIGSPVFGILIGMIIAMIYPGLLTKDRTSGSKRPESKFFDFEAGIKYTSKKILQYSIILLGFGMNLFNVIKVGGQSLFVIMFTLAASFVTAFFIGKAMKLEGKMTTLVAVGTSICGGSAIAATAPVIEAKDEDVAQAISTIFLFNIIAVFIFPALGHALGMTDMGFGMWAGTAINDTSSVVAAGTTWSNAAGNDTALAFATIVKLTRTLMIVPITLVLAIYTARKVQKNRSPHDGNSFSFVKVFPWFVIGFVATAVLNTFIDLPEISGRLVVAGKFMIVMAMAAIGLNTNLKKLITNGFKPIFLGLCCWFAVASVSLLVQGFMKTW
jgi:uncharacterized integral membrane protein (TIGR00698 family)